MPRLLIGLVSAAILLWGISSLFDVQVRINDRSEGTIEEVRELGDDELNVIFILIDTLRADRLGAYGYERETSPFLDSLARIGVRFANVESQSSWTKTSMASMWTSRFPPRAGILRYDDALPGEVVMPAEIFRDAGYVTAGLYRNGWVAENFGFQQGFETYVRPTPRKDTERFARADRSVARVPGTDEDVTLGAIEFLKTEGHRKFFLYLHYMDIHQYLYDEVAETMPWGASLSDVYDRSIHWTDRNIAALFNHLEQAGLNKKTIIVIGSDHGEAFFEHGREGHARDLYREVVHVPLIVSLPFRLSEGLVVQDPIRNVDIWPTVMDLVGLEAPEGLDGVSVVDRMLAAADARRLPDLRSYGYLDQRWGRVGKEPSPLVSVLDGGKKVFYNPTRPNRSLAAYDHTVDVAEQENLVNPKGGVSIDWVDALKADLIAFQQQEAAWTERPKVELDSMMLGQLRALGYAVDDDDGPVLTTEEATE